MAPTCASGSRSFNLASSAVLRADEVVWIPRPPGAIVHFGLKSAPSRRDFRPGRKSISKLVAWLSLSKQEIEDHRAPLQKAWLVRAGVGKGDAEVLVSKLGGHPSTRRSGQEADLDEVWLVHIFDGLGFL